MTDGLIIIVAVLALSSVGYWWWQKRDGVVREVDDPAGRLTSKTLGAPRGERATFVQFSTPVCAKCPGTRTLLTRIADEDDGVVHIDIDATVEWDLAKRFDVMRTPTILVLDYSGLPVARMSGAPSETQAREALEKAPHPGTEYNI